MTNRIGQRQTVLLLQKKARASQREHFLKTQFHLYSAQPDKWQVSNVSAVFSRMRMIKIPRQRDFFGAASIIHRPPRRRARAAPP